MHKHTHTHMHAPGPGLQTIFKVMSLCYKSRWNQSTAAISYRMCLDMSWCHLKVQWQMEHTITLLLLPAVRLDLVLSHLCLAISWGFLKNLLYCPQNNCGCAGTDNEGDGTHTWLTPMISILCYHIPAIFINLKMCLTQWSLTPGGGWRWGNHSNSIFLGRQLSHIVPRWPNQQSLRLEIISPNGTGILILPKHPSCKCTVQSAVP